MSTLNSSTDVFDDCAGIVVCGGASSRMETDKAHLPIGPESMLQRIVRTLGAVVSPVVLVAARGQSLPPCRGDIITTHDEQPNRGPLEGIRVGLKALPPGRHYAFVTGCDTPMLKAPLVTELLSRRAGYDLVLPRDADRGYPLTAVYHRDLADTIRDLLNQGGYGPIDLVRLVRTLSIDVEKLRAVDPHLDSLRNVNTPTDYQSMLRVNDGVE